MNAGFDFTRIGVVGNRLQLAQVVSLDDGVDDDFLGSITGQGQKEAIIIFRNSWPFTAH